jgi:YVTN family beta-propeller protein
LRTGALAANLRGPAHRTTMALHPVHGLAAAFFLLAPVAAQRLICVDSSRAIAEVDMATGTRTPLGSVSINASTTAGLAYDVNGGKLYVTSTGNDSLYVVDVTNWNATLVGAYGNPSLVMHGLEWDSSTNTLYGMSSHDGGLYTIDTTTGLATLVGVTGLTSFHNLGYDPVQNVLWMTNSNNDTFCSIDRTTGVATLIGPLTGPTNPNGLAYNTDNQTLYLVCNNTDTLYTIDTATGLATAIGPMGSSNLLGLVYIPGNGRLSRSVHGCGAATISVTGHPNTGFSVTTSLANIVGFPFVGYGLTAIGVPFCGCTIGHDWVAAAAGSSSTLTIPATPGLIGLSVFAQGLDFLAPGGCPDPLLTLTDTINITIG